MLFISLFKKNTFQFNAVTPVPGTLIPTIICDTAVGICDVLIVRQHILGTENKHTQHEETAAPASSTSTSL